MSRTRTLLPLALFGALALAAALALALGRGGPEPAAAATPQAAAAGRHGFQQALAAKLAGRLGRPLDDVSAALKAATTARAPKGDTREERRAHRRETLADRLAARAKALRSGDTRTRGATSAEAHERFDAWTARVAKPLGLTGADVEGAIRAMVDERLQGLVAEHWITDDQRLARLACFDDAAKCTPATRGSAGLAPLRAGVR